MPQTDHWIGDIMLKNLQKRKHECDKDTATEKYLSRGREAQSRQKATGDQNCSRNGAAEEKKNAAPKNEGKKCPRAKGEPEAELEAEQARFIAACQHRFVGRTPGEHLKALSDRDWRGPDTSPLEGP